MGIGTVLLLSALIAVVLFLLMRNKSGAVAPSWIPIEIRVTIPSKEYDQDWDVSCPSSGETHTVNLHGLVCSCEDQQKRRRYHRGDLRRHCTHLNELLRAEGFTARMRPMAAAVVDGGYTLGRRMEMFQVPASDEPNDFVPVLIAVNDANDWADVFAPDGNGGIRAFGFDIRTEQWADGGAPVASDRIGKYILSTAR